MRGIPEDMTPEDDRRHAPRRRALKEAKVVLSDWSVIDCLVRDLSDMGARVEFSAPTNLPSEFRLLVVATNVLLPAELKRQRGLSAGVRFSGPGKVAPHRKW